MRKILIGLFALWFFCPAVLISEERELTLDEAVARALANNPDILRAQGEAEVSRGRRLQLEAFPNPDLVFSNEGLSGKTGSGEREVSLGVRQLIEFPGKRSLRKMIGKYGEHVSASELERVKGVVVAKVKKAYYQAAFSQRMIMHLQSLLDVLQQYQEMARIRHQAGQVSTIDVLRGRVEYVKVQNDLVEGRRAFEKNIITLSLLMGLEKAERVKLQTELAFIPLGKNLEELQREAGQRPSLRALELEFEQAKAGVLLAHKNIYPDLRIGLFYPSLRTSAWGFELESTIPLWGKQRRGEIIEAEALSLERKISLESQKKRILALLEGSYADLKAAEDQIRLFEKSLLQDAEDMLQMGIINYQYGKIDSVSLFDLYKLFKETKSEYFKALLNYNISLADLEAVGEE